MIGNYIFSLQPENYRDNKTYLLAKSWPIESKFIAVSVESRCRI